MDPEHSEDSEGLATPPSPLTPNKTPLSVISQNLEKMRIRLNIRKQQLVLARKKRLMAAKKILENNRRKRYLIKIKERPNVSSKASTVETAPTDVSAGEPKISDAETSDEENDFLTCKEAIKAEKNDLEDEECQILDVPKKVIPIIDIDDGQAESNPIQEVAMADRKEEAEAQEDVQAPTEEVKEAVATEGAEKKEETKRKPFTNRKKQTEQMCHANHSRDIEHKKVVCLECNVRVCPICYYDDPTHIRYHISKRSGAYNCSICTVALPTPCSLKAHKMLHANRPPYVCPDCGVVYQQLRFLLEHFKDRCFHLYLSASFRCVICRKVLFSLADYEEHLQGHMGLRYACRVCEIVLGSSRQNAIRHVLTHAKSLMSSQLIQCYLIKTRFCDSCKIAVPANHWKVHTKKDSGYLSSNYKCTCGTLHSTSCELKRHIRKCPQKSVLPDYWNQIFCPQECKEKEKEGLPEKKEKNDVVDSVPMKREKLTIQSKVKKAVTCEWCHSPLKQGCRAYNMCDRCLEIRISCCRRCLAPNAVEGFCELCQLKRQLRAQKEKNSSEGGNGVANSWIAAEEATGSKCLDEYDTCAIDLPYISDDHNYCLQFNLVKDIIVEFDKQCTMYNTPFFTSPCTNPPTLPQAQTAISDSENSLTCFCGAKIHRQKDDIESLSLHIQKAHSKVILPLKPKPVDVDDESLMSRLLKWRSRKGQDESKKEVVVPRKKMRLWNRKDQEESTPEKDVVVPKKKMRLWNRKNQEESTPEEDIVVPRKKMRLYVPKPVSNLDKYSPEPEKDLDKSNIENVSRVINEVSQEPLKKEHEFWDEMNNALLVIDGRNCVKSKLDMDKLPVYTSKRQVKKPKRLLEEKDEEVTEALRRNKSDTETCSSSPERKSPSKENRLSDVKSPPLSKKKDTDAVSVKSRKEDNHKRSQEVDEGLEIVRNNLKKDEEIGFIRKTFTNSGGPNKRKRKLASKLVYLAKINETDYDLGDLSDDLARISAVPSSGQMICIICKTAFEKREFFREHLMTHRTDDNTFQCMECGECFVVRPSLEKHLHAFHKIKDTGKYIEENNCNKRLEEAEKGEEEEIDDADLLPNQCKVCKKVLKSELDLSKHFRVHGLAFLKEATKEIKAK